LKEHDTSHRDWTNNMSAPPATRLKASLFRRAKMFTLCAMIFTLLSGCGIIKFGVVATVGIVGFAGYAVYKTGEAVVVGAGKAGGAVATGVGAAVSVVFINGDFKTQYHGDVETVWKASRHAFQKAWFGTIEGSFDALTGTLTANTREGKEIKLKLKNIDAQTTEAQIRIGVTGDMEMSETIHNLILQELSSPPIQTGITTSVQEMKQ
jgi:hypothetical protein